MGADEVLRAGIYLYSFRCYRAISFLGFLGRAERRVLWATPVFLLVRIFSRLWSDSGKRKSRAHVRKSSLSDVPSLQDPIILSGTVFLAYLTRMSGYVFQRSGALR